MIDGKLKIRMKQKDVIVEGGFGGFAAANALAYEPVDIVLLDKQNHHLVQPLQIGDRNRLCRHD